MKVLLHLTPTAVADKEGHWMPAIDDGESVSYFDGHLYSGQSNAVDHAKQTIDNLQKNLNQTIANWHMNVKR